MIIRVYFLSLLIAVGFSQTNPIVTSINFQGNDVTKDYIIEREIQHPVNVPLDSSIVNEDKNRLLNLGIFNDVRWVAIPGEKGTVELNYIFLETWRYLPVVVPQYSETTGWSLLLGLAIKNFRGRNQSMFLNLSFGGMDAYGIAFDDPWIMGDHISLYANAWRQEYPHMFLPYDMVETYSNLIFGRYFGYSKKIKAGLEIIRREYQRSEESVILDYLSPKISLVYDTRDLYSNPTKGFYLIWIVDGKYGFGDENISFTLFSQSYSAYHSLSPGKKPWIIGINGTLNLYPGRVPYPRTEYIGGAYTIRGWPIPNNDIYSSGNFDYRFGLHSWMASLELRKTIIPTRVPVPGVEYGLDIGFFLDAGAISYTIGTLDDQLPMIGAGFGLRIPMTGYESIRFDYGYAYYNGAWREKSFNIAFGQKF